MSPFRPKGREGVEQRLEGPDRASFQGRSLRTPERVKPLPLLAVLLPYVFIFFPRRANSANTLCCPHSCLRSPRVCPVTSTSEETALLHRYSSSVPCRSLPGHFPQTLRCFPVPCPLRNPCHPCPPQPPLNSTPLSISKGPSDVYT